jgi:cytohesin
MLMLHGAVLSGCIKAVRVLLAGGVALEAVYASGATALTVAVQTNRVKIARLLLASGADASVRCKSGSTLVQIACGAGIEMMEALIRAWLSLDVFDDGGREPIHFAAFADSVAVVRKPISCGVNLDAMKHGGLTAAMLTAAQNPTTSVLQELILAGADVRKRDFDGDTAMHQAAEYGHVAAMQVLLAAGADPSARNDEGTTPLIRAATKGSRLGDQRSDRGGRECSRGRQRRIHAFACRVRRGRTEGHDGAAGGRR